MFAIRTSDAKSVVRSLAKGLRVLEVFTAQEAELTLSEVARRAGMDNGTAFRMLNTLELLGYLRRDAEGRHFRLSTKVLDLGFNALARAAYTSELLAELARLPHVKCFKIGTRDMNKYAVDIRLIREAAPQKAVITCHDEYLLASMVQGVDGALVGFASFIPQKIVALYEAVKAGDLKKAMQIQYEINPLKDVVYGMGEPTGEAHARMKYAMFLSGQFKSPLVRRPTNVPSGAVAKGIEEAVRKAGMLAKEAA